MRLNLFGRRRTSEKPGATTPTARSTQMRTSNTPGSQVTIDSLAKMRETMRNLEKREAFLEAKAATQLEEATAKNKAGDKKGAVVAMTRKKLFDAEIAKLAQMRTNLEAQMLSLESANVTLVAQGGMQAGLDAQRYLAKFINADGVADMQEEIEEHMNNADEVSRILSGSLNAGEVFDPDDLLAELNDSAQAEATPASRQSSSKEAVEDDELGELQRLMGALPAAPSHDVESVDPEERSLKMGESELDLLRLKAEMNL